jgi:hypothetical protein
MNAPRLDPTALALPTGNLLVVGGITTGGGTDNVPQVYDTLTGAWRNLTTATQAVATNSWLFDAPNGDAFLAGPTPATSYLDTFGTGRWIPVGNTVLNANRLNGTAVEYAPGKILILGGQATSSSLPTATAEVIDLNWLSPDWQSVGSLNYARKNANAVVLADGEVLVIGGNQAAVANLNPALVTELWNPITRQFTTGASLGVNRATFSTAQLLPDGTVLIGGGTGNASSEVYTPDYLLNNSPRPTITSAPSSVNLGSTFFVGTPTPGNIWRVTLVRLGSSTLGQDSDEAFSALSYTVDGNGKGIDVTVPASTASLTPGQYMLFIWSGQDVPSLAATVQIVQPPSTAASFQITSNPPTAGSPRSFTITALNGDGTTATNYVGTVHFTSTDSKAVLPGDYTFTTADQGVHSFTATYFKSGTQSLIANDARNATISGNLGVMVNAAPASVLIATFPVQVNVATTGSFTVTAKDPYGNVATDYRGTVKLTSTDAKANFATVNYTFNATDAGVHTFKFNLYTAGTQTITVADSTDSELAITSPSIKVVAYLAASFTVTGYPSPTTVGAANNFVVTVYDAYQNVVQNFTGTVQFTSSDTQAMLPKNYQFQFTDSGQHVFSATFETAGTQSLTATLVGKSLVKGIQSGIEVDPA